MDIRELLSALHKGFSGSPDNPDGGGGFLETFVDNVPDLHGDLSGEIVPVSELEQEFLEREYARLHPEGSYGEAAPTLDSIQQELFGEYRGTLESLFGIDETNQYGPENAYIDELMGEFDVDSRNFEDGSFKRFVPLWSPVDRERLTQAFDTGGIDAVNEAFPEYGGLELPRGEAMEIWMKDRDMIEQLLPANQIPVMEAHNRLAYLNRLRESAGSDGGIPQVDVQSYRGGGGPFLRSGVNRFENPQRRNHVDRIAGQPHYMLANAQPAMSEMAEGSNSPSVTGAMNYLNFFPEMSKYNSQIRDAGADAYAAPIASLGKAAGLAYQNAANKMNLQYNEAMPTSRVQSPSYYERRLAFDKNYEDFQKSQPPNGIQQGHGALEGVLGADVSKELMEGPYGPAIGLGFDVISEVGDLSPAGAFGEAFTFTIPEVLAKMSKTGANIGLLAKAAKAGKAMLPDVAGEGLFDGLINTGANAINTAAYGGGAPQEVRPPGEVGAEIDQSHANLKKLMPLPQEKGGFHLWNNEDNHVADIMNERRDDGFPVDRMMQNEPYRQDLYNAAKDRRVQEAAREARLQAEKDKPTPSFFPKIMPM